MTFDSDTLLMLAGKGSRDAMGELYRRHKPQVVAFFGHMRAGGEQAEDLAQEVFLRIWKSADRYRPAGKYNSFMFTVAANVWRDQRRRSSLREQTWVQNDYIEAVEDDLCCRTVSVRERSSVAISSKRSGTCLNPSGWSSY